MMAWSKRELGRERDRLYGLELEKFTAERNALAKRLVSEKERGGAEEVRGLPKPDATAWAINQAVRRDPGARDDVQRAGKALGEAQARIYAGRGDRGRLREAVQAERAAVQRLVDLAAQEARRADRELHRDRAASTLHAANADEDLGQALRAGRLTRWAQHISLGPGGASDVAADPRAASSKERKQRGDERRRRASEKRAAERALEAAKKKAARARDRLEEARTELSRLESAHEAAAREQAAAEDRLSKIERDD